MHTARQSACTGRGDAGRLSLTTAAATVCRMAFELARMIKRLGIRRRAITFAAIFPSQSQADSLGAIYLKIVRAWMERSRDQIIPTFTASMRQLANQESIASMLTVDSPEDVATEIGSSAEYVNRLVLTLTPALRDWVVRAESLHRSRFVANAKTAAGVDLSTILGTEGVETTLGAAYEENLSLIRNISEDVRSRIGRIVFEGFRNRTPRRELAKQINDAVQIGRKRALLIASDQSTKLSARLDQERQEEIGISEFIWVHSGKLHYRPAHKRRDGKRYSWQNNNLNGDLPGVAIHCGCKARAFVDLGE